MKKICIILLFCALRLTAQEIVAAEYFINNDPGLGNATAITNVPQSSNVGFSISVTNPMTTGTHMIGYRTQDTNGVWSHTSFTTFNIVEPAGTSAIQSLEYFWDDDAGFGNNFILELSSGTTQIESMPFSFTVPDLTVGQHSLFVRSRDAHAFSHTNYRLDVEVSEELQTQSFEMNGIACYPNPVQETLHIKLDSGKSRLFIYDINGKLIIDKVVSENDNVDMRHLPVGVYSAYFWKETNKIYVTKIIKQ